MNSRLIVKNIPKNIDEKKIKAHFEKFGEVTDVKIILGKDKKEHRRFCFVGYKNPKSGKDAQQYFNNTYLNTSKIMVEFAKTKDDNEQIPDRQNFLKNGKKKGSILLESKRDKKFQKQEEEVNKADKFKEFLELMKSGSTGNMSWNDVLYEKKQKEKGAQNKNKKQNAKQQQKENEKVENNLQKLEQQMEQKNNEKKQKKSSTQIEEENNNNKDQQEDQQVKKINDKRLYVVNLPYKITEDEVKELFQKYGQVTELKLPYKDRAEGITKGFCFVTYELVEEAMRCFSELDNKIVYGRIMHIRPSYEQPEQPVRTEYQQYQLEKNQEEDFVDKEKSSYKKLKKIEMRKRLEDQTNWNTLFLNPNSILESISAQYNIKKSDILSAEAEDLAVRTAHAETQVIKETKEWMLTQGLNLAFLEEERQECKRSETILLVKNLPYTIQEDKLRDIFSHYGSIDKVMLSPNKALGIVEFLNKSDADNAFKNLSYHIIKHNPMYLEWAPLELIEQEKQQQQNNNEQQQNQQEQEEEEQEEENSNLSLILYVKNLNFKTTDQGLQKHFEQANVGELRSVRIVKNKGGKKEGLSSGYGFVEFKTQDGVSKSLKKLQNSKLDEHQIKLSISKQKVQVEPKKQKKQKINHEASSKIVVRNLAFESTKHDIRNLFKNYGEIKSVRLPQKINGQHRGFAFVEFVSMEEAKNAVSSLANTHLYGRKLAIEYAKQDFDQ